jgi:hypothetical protein
MAPMRRIRHHDRVRQRLPDRVGVTQKGRRLAAPDLTIHPGSEIDEWARCDGLETA